MPCTSSKNNWRQWAHPLAVSLYLLSVIVTVHLCIWEIQRAEVRIHSKGSVLATAFTWLTVPVSLWGILQHVVHYTQPELQKPTIRILWMVPVYSLDSWVALIKPSTAVYLNTFRECYEAYVIYNFMILLNNYLTRQYPDLIALLESKKQRKHFVPFCYFPPWEMGEVLLFRCKLGVLQYAAVRIVTTVVAFICQSFGIYYEGTFSLKNSWTYLLIINNVSQVFAMYCFILFYSTLKEELKPLHPIGKLVCVKLIIFVSFWQGIIIAVLVKFKVISRGPLWDCHSPEEVAIGLQDFLICLEMFVAGIAHSQVFSHKPYVRSQEEEGSWFKAFLDMWDLSDLKEDVAEQISHMGSTISGKRKPKNHTEGQDEKFPTGGQDEKKNSPSLPPTSEEDVSSLPRAVTHQTAHTVTKTPEEKVGDTAGARKCGYIALTIPDEVVSDSTEDTSEMGDEVVKEVEQ